MTWFFRGAEARIPASHPRATTLDISGAAARGGRRVEPRSGARWLLPRPPRPSAARLRRVTAPTEGARATSTVPLLRSPSGIHSRTTSDTRRPRNRPSRLRKRGLDRGPGGRDRVGELVGIAPARLRHGVAPAAPAAGDLRRRLDHLAGLHAALDERGRDRRDEVDPAVDDAAEHDRGAVAELALHPIGDVHERLRVRRVDDLGDDARAVARAGALRERGGVDRRLRLRLRRRLGLGAERRDRLDGPVGRHAQRLLDVGEDPVALAHEPHRLGAGDRLDAAHVRRARALRQDLEQPDLGGRAHVRAAAQLARVRAVGDVDHAHDVAVLLAEQRGRAEALGLVERRRDRPHGVVADDPLVDAVLDRRAILGRQALGVAEVEAQLVGPAVRAGLVDVHAEALAQRRVEQVRRGVVARGGVAREAVDARDDALAGAQLALDRLDDDRLVVARAQHVGDEHLAVAVLALDRARVRDLAAARRVERRLGELDVRAAVALEPAGDRRVLLEVLVAGELARLVGDLAHDVAAGARARTIAGALGPGALLVHQARELLVARERDTALRGDLARQVDREAVGVVQPEGVLAGDLAPREQVVEQARALLERAAEALLLGAHPLQDRLPAGDQLGVGVAHHVDDDLDELRQETGLDPDAVALLDRAAHDPAQDVAAVLVGRHDTIGDQERSRARVVGEDAQRALVVGAGGELAPEVHQGRELVGLEDRRLALLDQGHAVQAQAGV